MKQTSKAVSAKLVKAILFSPTTSFGLPYSLPTASLIYRDRKSVCSGLRREQFCRGRCIVLVRRERTCISTFCPSPLFPPTVAVTTTRVSLLTKFRMHRSCGLDSATRSNLRANDRRGRRQKRRSLSNDRVDVAMLIVRVDQRGFEGSNVDLFLAQRGLAHVSAQELWGCTFLI